MSAAIDTLLAAVQALVPEVGYMTVHRCEVRGVERIWITLTTRTEDELQALISRLGMAAPRLERGERTEWPAADLVISEAVRVTAYGPSHDLVPAEERAA